MEWSPVDLGFAIGAIPTVCMLLASMVLYSIEVSDHVEAAFQNFAAGLILAAVAAELFPLVAEVVVITTNINNPMSLSLSIYY